MELLSTIKRYLISHGSLHRAATLRHQEHPQPLAKLCSQPGLLHPSPCASNNTHILFTLPVDNSTQGGSPQLPGKDSYVQFCPSPDLDAFLALFNQMWISCRMPAMIFNLIISCVTTCFLPGELVWFSYTITSAFDVWKREESGNQSQSF